jgi:integrase
MLKQLTMNELAPVHELDSIDEDLARGGLRDSSLKRYAGAARSWKRYCLDRHEPFWNASTRTLIGWLDSRCRKSSSPASALKMSISAARFLQRGHCVLNEIDAIPYTPTARVQLEAWSRTATMNRVVRRRARPLRLAELDAVLDKIRNDQPVRSGVSAARGATLAERDICMLLLGWWGALRADDLARLDWAGVHVLPCGAELTLHESKTSNQAAILALATRPDCPRLCPVQALTRLRSWAEHEGDSVLNLASGNNAGRRMRHLFQRYELRGYTGHSLRAGFATECAAQGVPDKLVQAHGRWRTAQQHSEYVRLARVWDDTPTKLVRLPE